MVDSQERKQFMGQEIPEQKTDETSTSTSINPTAQQDGAPVPLRDDTQSEADNTSSQLTEGSSLPAPDSPDASPSSRPIDVIPASAEQESGKRGPRKVRRTDSGNLHRTKHGILSREALNALVQQGESRKTFRRLERQYRVALRPIGPFGDLFFDRFWSAYLKLILIGRLETQLFSGKSVSKSKSASLALVPGRLPTLVSQHTDQPVDAIPSNEELDPDLMRGLLLAQRYDRHHSREMYRSLALLLLLRRGGEAALESWASEMLGAEQPRTES